MSTPITAVPGTLGYDCFPSPQQLNNDIITLASFSLNQNFPGIYVGPTEPPEDQRDRIWFNTVSWQLYTYTNGLWQRKYYPLTGSGELRMFEFSASDLITYEGGSAGPVGDSTGPLWEIAAEYAGRVPVGVGLVPGSDPAATITAVGDTQDSLGNAGEYKHVLIPAEFQHFHGVGTDGLTDDPPTMLSRAWSSVKNFVRRINDMEASGSGWHDDTTPLSTGTMGSTEPYVDPNFPTSNGHLNMQPYKAVYFIRRTARIYVPAPY